MKEFEIGFREEQVWNYTFVVKAENEEEAIEKARARFKMGDQAEDSWIDDVYATNEPEYVCELIEGES